MTTIQLCPAPEHARIESIRNNHIGLIDPAGNGWRAYFDRWFEGCFAGFWVSSEDRRDQHGRQWHGYPRKCVVDEFGDLVEVTQ